MNNVIHKLTYFCSQKLFSIATIFLAFGGTLASALWISTPYSYWYDELYSLTLANETWTSLYAMLLSDVHPPLYQLFLKSWILAFGDNEQSTRFLSWIFANAAALYFFRSAQKHGRIFGTVAILFFLTNTLYAHYANETRSYAMSLFFATIVAVHFPVNKSKPSLIFLFACIMLSLTHYFGLILAGISLALCFLQNIKHQRSLLIIFATGLICLLWPIYHITFGEMLNKSGGNFWIQVHGIHDSLKIAASGYLPRTGLLGGIIFVLGLFLGMTLAINIKGKIEHCLSNVATVTLNSSLVSLIFLMVIASIDLWSPISTKRNYIVLLPFIGIVIAGVITIVAHKSPAYSKKILGVFLVFCVVSLYASFDTVYRKSHKGQDWRGASLYLIKNHNDKSIFHTSGSGEDPLRHLVVNFYLKKFSGGSLEAIPYVIDQTVLGRPAVVLFGHEGTTEAFIKEMTVIGAKQSYSNINFIDIKKGSVGVYEVK
jgi:hypothetical protein